MPSAAPTATRPATTTTGLERLRAAFTPVAGYLDAATCGLPSTGTQAALRDAISTWAAGGADPHVYDEAVAASRAAYARLVRVDPSAVAVGSQTSVMVGTVAASLPDGARVVVVEDDFTSVVFPYLTQAHRGVQVQQVPLEALADTVAAGCDVVSYSLVQSRDGRVADHAAVREAAARVGATTVVDTTQAAGWLPVDAASADVTVCSAYKWLAAPRGTAFLTVTDAARERLHPVDAGWYAGEDPWASTYGPRMRLAADARRFDVSPAWLSWVGAAPVLEAFADADPADVHAYDRALTDRLCAGLDRPASGSAVVALPDPDGTVAARLAAAGLRTSVRAGGVRLAFHVWNDTGDVDRAVEALRP